MIGWIAGAVVLLSVILLAWAASRAAASLSPLQRAQRRLNDTLQAGQAAMAPRLADLKDQVAAVQRQVEAVKAAQVAKTKRGSGS